MLLYEGSLDIPLYKESLEVLVFMSEGDFYDF